MSSNKVHQRVRNVPVTVKPVRPAPEETASKAEPEIPLAVAIPMNASTEEVLVEGVGTVLAEVPSTAEAEAQMAEGTPVKGPVVDDEDVDLSLLEGPAPATEESHTGFLEIHRTECLQCKALVPYMKKTYKECHYTKGNQNCPAREVQVVIRIPLNEILPRWLRYEREGDYAGIARMAAKLSEKPDYYQQRVKDALTEARKDGSYS